VVIRAVIFDLGGVVLGSPLHAIAAYEREHGIAAGSVNRVVAHTGADGAWGQLERGLLDFAAFARAFEAECAVAGFAIDARVMFERMAAASQPRPAMLEAIRALRAHGLRVAALTNNWPSESRDDGMRALRDHFDAFFESSVLGLQKPDPRIYQHACSALAIAPEQAIFLDDIGRNLKTARALGMKTIKVDTPEHALAELAGLVGFQLFPSGHHIDQDIEIG
jgi:epoxide hydrolase-like predicted phosphatase